MRLLAPAVGIAVVLLFALVPATLATTTTVTNCANDSQFSSALAGGGTITFNCGTATIVLTSTKTIAAATTIKGGDKITLSGNNARQLFVVNVGASLDLQHIVLTKGSAGPGDGGAVVANGFFAMENSTIRDSAAGKGGAFVSTNTANITDSNFFGNSAISGGAVYANGSSASVTVARGSVHDNSATGTTNATGEGGGILLGQNAHLDVYGTDVFNNSGRDGGAVSVSFGATFTLQSQAKVRNNHATDKANGIFNTGTAILSNVTVSNNTPTGSNLVLGGGIYNYSSLTVTSSTINGNTAYYGGGLSNTFSPTGGGATLSNVTISGNTAQAFGGGLDNYHATATLTNVTIAGNHAGNSSGTGGGILNEPDNNTTPLTMLNLKNVLLVNNPGDNCFFEKAPNSASSNMSTDGTCGFGASRSNQAVKLGALETNGGLTPTQRLLPGSPGIDAGNNSGAPGTDQRGVTQTTAWNRRRRRCGVRPVLGSSDCRLAAGSAGHERRLGDHPGGAGLGGARLRKVVSGLRPSRLDDRDAGVQEDRVPNVTGPGEEPRPQQGLLLAREGLQLNGLHLQ